MPSNSFAVPSSTPNSEYSVLDNVENSSVSVRKTRKNSFSRRLGSIALAASVAGSALVAAPAAFGANSASATEITAEPTETPTVDPSTDPTPINVDPEPAETAAPVVKKSASISIKHSKPTWTKGYTANKMTVSVKFAGKPATGAIKIFSGSQGIKTLALKNGKVSYRFNQNLTAKKHSLNIKFIPKGATAKVAKTTTKKTTMRVKQSTSQALVAEAKKHIGVRYVSGGTTPRGFDCSGFTSYVYKKALGKKLPRTSSSQRYSGKVVSKANAKPGDIIWSPGHVAIYLGGNKMIDAPRPGKTVQVRNIWQPNAKFISL